MSDEKDDDTEHCNNFTSISLDGDTVRAENGERDGEITIPSGPIPRPDYALTSNAGTLPEPPVERPTWKQRKEWMTPEHNAALDLLMKSRAIAWEAVDELNKFTPRGLPDDDCPSHHIYSAIFAINRSVAALRLVIDDQCMPKPGDTSNE